MERFARTLILYILLPLPVLYAIQYAVDHGLRRSHGELFAEWNDIYAGNIKADLIVLGSSRAWVHYSPEILERETGLSTYNLGLDGNPFPMQKARFGIYLAHNPKPKYLIQNLDNSFLRRSEELYESEQYLPYLSDPAIQDATKGYKGGFTWTQEYIPLFKYNNEPRLVAEGVELFLGKNDTPLKYKGFQGQEREWDGSFEAFQKANPNGVEYTIDPEVEQQFRAFLVDCKAKGIQVILVYSPEYIEVQKMGNNRSWLMGTYEGIANDLGVPFLDYSGSPLSMDKSNFYNSQHLNARGAEQFSLELAAKIRPFLSVGDP